MCRSTLLGSRFEYNHAAFVRGDDPIELFQLVGLAGRDAELLDFIAPGVPDDGAAHFRLGMVGAEAVIGVDGRRILIDDISGRYGDFKGIGVEGRAWELNCELARFLGLEEARGLGTDDAGTYEQQVSRRLGVIRSLKGVVKAEREIILLKVGHGCLGDVEGG